MPYFYMWKILRRQQRQTENAWRSRIMSEENVVEGEAFQRNLISEKGEVRIKYEETWSFAC